MNTELGTRLKAIRERIVASGGPLLDWDGVTEEVRRQRIKGIRLSKQHRRACELVAFDRQRARDMTDAEIDAWAKRIADDVCDATD